MLKYYFLNKIKIIVRLQCPDDGPFFNPKDHTLLFFNRFLGFFPIFIYKLTIESYYRSLNNQLLDCMDCTPIILK